MSDTVKTIICPACGAPADKLVENCNYCGSFLVHLTKFELKDKKGSDKNAFNPLTKLYKFSAIAGLTAAAVIYLALFAFLSEDMLVMISPAWFLLLHFGISGLFGEKAIEAIINDGAENFSQGLDAALEESAPIVKFSAMVTFLPMVFIFNMKKITSPLKLAGLTTLIWAGLLYVFLVAIFPAL